MTAVQQPTPMSDAAQESVGVPARPTFRARAGHGASAFLRRAAKILAIVVVLLLLWKLVTVVFGIRDFLLPPPEQVLEEMWANAAVLWGHTLVTAQEVVVGFLIAAVLGLGCAILMTASQLVARLFYPALVISQAIPKVAIAPLLVVWLGFGQPTIITIVVIIAFFPVAVSGAGGLREVPRDLVMLGNSMGLRGARLFRKIMIPYALGAIFSGLKVGMTLALIGAVVGEFVTGQSGLGYYIQSSSSAFNVAQSFGGIIAIVVLGLVAFKLVELAESLAMPWRREHSAFTASA
ncbi:ABC transporter permease [Geodermatophilus sabuli]|uniref:ABC transporter permease n=1 Tax=Geodermatophilus sabuli TaxID=1564158 RepID=A0A7K3W222_9ACTN|nr:ABC transporter permease [Geodermatophilus sabuli]NEK58254.1 ABC transporter permease [Geodermatophilus sabuli]